MSNVTSGISIVNTNDLQSYSTVYELYESMKAMTDNKVFQKIYYNYASDVAMVFDYFDNEAQNPEYNGHLSILELQAIMLRLSRHHIKRAKTIENIAHFFKELIDFHKQEGNMVPIVFQQAELIDRPSLMVLNRLMRLLQKEQANINFEFIFEKNVFASNDVHNIVQSRVQVFEKLDRLTNIRQHATLRERPLTSEDFKLKEGLYRSHILDAAIIEQNFELALQILHQSLQSSKENKIITDQIAYRNIGVIEANLGNFNKSLTYFDEAIAHSKSVLELSRNSYIKGLCLIKRLKRVEEGVKVITEALQQIEENFVEDDVKYKHEKAWLINGLCLGKTILASKMDEESKKETCVNIIQKEMEAYRLISHETSFHLIYLKFNLLANIAFLLEILGENKKAIHFWEQSFAPILANDGEYREGEKALTYRLGVLNIKLTHYEQSELFLQRALDLTRNENNPFHLSVILYALGYLKILQGSSDEALLLLQEGKDIALHLGDSNSIDLFQKGIQYYRGDVAFDSLERPKVKLISYIPYIDLSFVPEIDLNKALTS